MTDLSYIKKEWKRLGSLMLLISGSFLVIEHVWTYGFITLKDFLGHEWLGIGLIIAGLLAANKKWSGEQSPLSYAWSKIKYIFGKSDDIK